MELKLYDTLTREKRAFTPIDPKRVRMYVCGPTVYDFAHIGNARPVIVFDVLYRLLRHLYGKAHVKYVRNITDVDDKINARAAERGIAIRELTEETYRNFKDDVAALGCLPPDVEPRATEHIDEMRVLIEKLVASGHAYVAEEHVLFSVPSMTDYGQLSKRPLDEMIAGARVDVAPYKRDPMDFVLWKPSTKGEPGWPSPAGIMTQGRPGWHIECSAMSWKHLGETFDIHGGGIDLVFPHHENEIAQSRCAFHTGVMANVWMHNGFLQVEGEKMAKSTGNFVTMRELLRSGWRGRTWSGNVGRLAMLGTHYRQPIDWSARRLEESERELFAICSELLQVAQEVFHNDTTPFAQWLSRVEEPVDELFIEALCDDLNTPGAIAVIRQKFNRISSNLEVAGSVLSALEFLGVVDRQSIFLNSSPVLRGIIDREAMHGAFLAGRKFQIALLNGDQGGIDQTSSLFDSWSVKIEVAKNVGGLTILSRDENAVNAQKALIESLMTARAAARATKNWNESDRIRDELAQMGIEVEDHRDRPSTWKAKQ